MCVCVTSLVSRVSSKPTTNHNNQQGKWDLQVFRFSALTGLFERRSNENRTLNVLSHYIVLKVYIQKILSKWTDSRTKFLCIHNHLYPIMKSRICAGNSWRTKNWHLLSLRGADRRQPLPGKLRVKSTLVPVVCLYLCGHLCAHF